MEASSVAVRALTARTVHVKLYPTPRSFPERREVLRVLERFGEVSMFRSLKVCFRNQMLYKSWDVSDEIKYNRKHQNPVHNAFLVLFASESAANELLNASPLRYSLVSEPISADQNEHTPVSEQQEPQSINFSLNASSTTYNHHKALTGSQNPLHGPFRPISPSYSYIGSSLERAIPETLWSKGLMDWETDKGEDVLDGRIDGARLSTAGENGKNTGGLERWDMMRRGEGKIPAVMYGLRNLAQQRKRVTTSETHAPKDNTKT